MSPAEGNVYVDPEDLKRAGLDDCGTGVTERTLMPTPTPWTTGAS